jgi:hypothetical protein
MAQAGNHPHVVNIILILVHLTGYLPYYSPNKKCILRHLAGCLSAFVPKPTVSICSKRESEERDFLIQAVHSPSRGRHRDNRGPDIRFGRSYLLIQEEKEIRDFIFDKFVV